MRKNRKFENGEESFSIDDIISKNTEFFNVLKSSGRARPLHDFPVLQTYIESAGSHPFCKNFSEISINHIDFMKEISTIVQETLFTRETINEKTFESFTEYGFFKLSKGYFVEVTIGYMSIDTFSDNIQDVLRKLSHKDNYALISSINLLCPPPTSSLINKDLEQKVIDLVKKHHIAKNTTTPCIGMICSEDGNFYIRDFYIKKDYTLKHADLHYGKNFVEFHEKLIERFRDDSKGLVLFHGSPGTGKTFYIRSLIKDLISAGKFVIYLPPNMVDYMVDPNMMTFLSSTVIEKAEEGKSCVLLLEDAEPLLISRSETSRSNGITNLLNVTDGLLNDMLSIQVIATFNTDLSNIDKALLRPERLIARKEFKKLKKEDANILANALEIEPKFNSDTTLAEIYSQMKNNDILVHEYDNEDKKIGFKR